ncbi:DUF6174 domain-containing protein [Spartinivicinus poritis]|uniref:DUF6174 domain-containing protein n=1 Tax=Spartinivicinus poritis TaxID=2994640 RepID=A0ABT5UE91_9GAMM|nr:DUF6174 domain-containing protein [Spartinivicinus sp. A2-2]MDE1464678.1 DUF6174 domain-containing protein [Spartinivicinus sp. A2-2]
MALKKMLALALTTALSASVSANSTDPWSEDFTKDFKPEVATYLARWYKNNYNDYTYIYRYFCFCAEAGKSFTVDVRDNKVKKVTYTDTNQEVPESFMSMFSTIDGLFVDLVKANKNAHKINVQFNKRHGNPTNVYIDQDPRIADEETAYVIDRIFPILP